jgi:hypothetical protein
VSQSGGGASLFGRLLWPEQTPVSDLERELAVTRISHAKSAGQITEADAADRLARLSSARTRLELRVALNGLPGAVAPAGLLGVRRIAVLLWAVLTVVNFVIWALICLISGSWDDPWWLWTVLGGALVVGGLWWVTEWEHRSRLTGDRERPDNR